VFEGFEAEGLEASQRADNANRDATAPLVESRASDPVETGKRAQLKSILLGNTAK
jgi:hypothetical protein